MVKEYVYPNRSVHITRRDLGNKTKLRPSKEYTPEGVSFAPTVRHSLEGVPFYYTKKSKDWKRRRKFVKEGDEWNVYTPVRKRVAVVPSTISDFKRTRERRVLSKVAVKKIGRIKVKVGNNKWEYKWV
jgi:hypothetical protein